MESCATCVFGEFKKTPTGRINRTWPGRCRYEPLPLPALPVAANPPKWPPNFVGVWDDMGGPDECHVYQPKDKS